ncbi:MAG: hypothetical protein DRP92_07975 [Candidatus Neomarinimicrobiota bacterium]|nr:MAG: hypothetical protein DRP92_07975 [Candidatus Neomarinimicrobiota bacterium]
MQEVIFSLIFPIQTQLNLHLRGKYRNGYRDRNVLTRLCRLEIDLARDKESSYSAELPSRYK